MKKQKVKKREKKEGDEETLQKTSGGQSYLGTDSVLTTELMTKCLKSLIND